MRRLAIWSAILLSCQAFSCGHREAEVGPSRPASRPAASAPAPADDRAALAELARLEALARAAVEKESHALVTAAVVALENLKFAKLENAALRNLLAREFRAEAVRLRDGLHRFLFPELAALPAKQRKELLDLADLGQTDAIERAAAALAEQQLRAGRVWLRATPALKPRTIDPASGLPVRAAGDVKRIWQSRFNRAFNARMRALLKSKRTATRPGR